MHSWLSHMLGMILLAGVLGHTQQAWAQEPGPSFGMAIHGGAGTISRGDLTPELEQQYREKLSEALTAGYQVLSDGGSSTDAVVTAIQILEASPLFNAGVGAVFTNEGTVELDASIMDGQTLQAGAVAGVKHVESPIALARAVMDASPHVMLAGEGAEAFAREQGFPMVENAMFQTERRRRQLERIQQAEQDAAPSGDARLPGNREADAHVYGTVGAVALDKHGNLAAGTSTGGMTNKRFGRIGDSPIIGAGTYADNATCAISSTGHGEYYIRGVLAHEVAAMMRYTNLSLTEAAHAVINGKLTAMGGTGGLIAIDRAGNVAMPFNTSGMYRGHIDADGTVTIHIYRD